MNNSSLANVQRPTTFSEVVGQTYITDTLQHHIKNQELRQSYLFAGPSGTGKTTCARILANELQATMYEIDAASNNGIDDVRALIADTQIRPITSKYKVYIVDEAQNMSRSAWDASLKIIEEPPVYCIFIFCTTNPNKIPDTILSRLTRLDFKSITQNDVIYRLQQICEYTHSNFNVEALNLIAKHCGGNMREAVQSLEKCLINDITVESVQRILGYTSEELVQKFIRNLCYKKLNESHELYNTMLSNADIYRNVYDDVIDMLCDILFRNDLKNREQLIRILQKFVNYRTKAYTNEQCDAVFKLIIFEVCADV